LDECETGLHNCHDDAYCTNTKRSFTCTCKPGYSGDGVNCAGNKATYAAVEHFRVTPYLFPDVDECNTEKHQCDEAISLCVNTKGSFECYCQKGYFKSGQHKCTGNIHFKIS
ncbi:unnamed protein product, partial [Porites lobata]